MISCLYSMQGESLPLDHSLRSVRPPEPPLLLRGHLLLVKKRKCTGHVLGGLALEYMLAGVRSCRRSYLKLRHAHLQASAEEKKKKKNMKVRQVDNSHVALLHVNASLCLFLRSLKTASSLTYRGTSTCGIPCQEVYWSCRNTPPTSHISPSTTWD